MISRRRAAPMGGGNKLIQFKEASPA